MLGFEPALVVASSSPFRLCFPVDALVWGAACFADDDFAAVEVLVAAVGFGAPASSAKTIFFGGGWKEKK